MESESSSKSATTKKRPTQRSPLLLKTLLAKKGEISTTPESNETDSRALGKRSLQANVDCESSSRSITETSKKKRKTEKEFLESAMKAVHSDKEVCDLLNMDLCPTDGDAEKLIVMVTTKMLYYHEPVKHIPRLKLVLSGDGTYYIQVLLRTFEEGTVTTPEQFRMLCQKLSDSINYKFCPGIGVEEYQSFKDVIKYNPKQVSIIESPVKRVESTRCKRWHALNGISIGKMKRESPEVLCSECVALKSYLYRSTKRLANVDSQTELQHQKASSYYPKKYLSPESLRIRNANIEEAKARQKKMLKRHEPNEVLSDDDKPHPERSQSHTIKVSSTCFKRDDSQQAKVESALLRVLKQDNQQDNQ